MSKEERRSLGEALGLLVGIAGILVIGNLLQIVWVSAGIVVLSLAFAFRGRAFHALESIRGRAALEAEAQRLREGIQASAVAQSSLEEQARLALLQGIRAGQQEMAGFLTGSQMKDVPTLTMVVAGADELVFSAELPEPSTVLILGTRFALIDQLSGDCKGIMEVVVIDEETRLNLTCVREVNPEFWRVLRDRAALDSAIPNNLALTRPTLEMRHEFLSEVLPFDGNEPINIEEI